MSQGLTFSQTVNKLFFGVDVSDNASSLFDGLLSIPQLRHHHNGARQWNLNVTIEMKSEKAWSSRHEFTFTQSPVTDLNIEQGIIEVRIGETDSTKKLLDIYWKLQFDSRDSASKYFEKLKQIFGDISTKKKFDFDKDVGDIAQFSARKRGDKGVNDITLFLNQWPGSTKYEIVLVLGNELTDE